MIAVALVMAGGLFLQFMFMLWPALGQPSNQAEKILQVVYVLLWMAVPVFGLFCLVNFFAPDRLGFPRPVWFFASFLPVTILLCIAFLVERFS